jgi:hypothetical protein
VVIIFYDGNVFGNAGIDPSLLDGVFLVVGERVATALKALWPEAAPEVVWYVANTVGIANTVGVANTMAVAIETATLTALAAQSGFLVWRSA